jgi:hypothetical protein
MPDGFFAASMPNSIVAASESKDLGSSNPECTLLKAELTRPRQNADISSLIERCGI